MHNLQFTVPSGLTHKQVKSLRKKLSGKACPVCEGSLSTYTTTEELLVSCSNSKCSLFWPRVTIEIIQDRPCGDTMSRIKISLQEEATRRRNEKIVDRLGEEDGKGSLHDVLLSMKSTPASTKIRI